MKLQIKENRPLGFTQLELLAVVLGISLLAVGMLLAQVVGQTDAKQRVCVNNLKQIGVAFRIWEGDYGDRYPMTVPTAKGGSQEALAGPNMFRHFAVMSNEIVNPRLLICPADDRQPAQNYSTMSNTNISYFVGLDADETMPAMFLAGDRNLVTNGVPVKAGLVVITATDTLGWSQTIHMGAGNVGLADGSVQQTGSASLQQLSQHTGAILKFNSVPTTRLAVP